MKCCYCKKEILSHESYQVYSLDGDFIHLKCIEEDLNTRDKMFDDLVNYIKESNLDELTEFLKAHDIKFEED